MKRLLVLIGGRGSNLEAILKAIEAKQIAMHCVGVISHRADASGLLYAKRHDVSFQVIEHAHKSRTLFESKLLKAIHAFKPDVCALAGFMRILSSRFIEQMPCPMLNIHPSLLPDYKGLHSLERAFADQVPEIGSTVHLVTQDLDGGPILGQIKLQVRASDTLETLKSRLLPLEHQLYVHVLQWIADRQLKLTHPPTFESNTVPPEGLMVQPTSLKESLI